MENDNSGGFPSQVLEPPSGRLLAKRRSQEAQHTTLLPIDFVPGAYDVIVGRGSACFNHVGNQNFRQLIDDHFEEYIQLSKQRKSMMIDRLVQLVRHKSGKGGFVKKDKQTGRYFEVGDHLAREKTSQAFRDVTDDETYRSSNSAKKKRRRNASKVNLSLVRQNSAPTFATEPSSRTKKAPPKTSQLSATESDNDATNILEEEELNSLISCPFSPRPQRLTGQAHSWPQTSSTSDESASSDCQTQSVSWTDASLDLLLKPFAAPRRERQHAPTVQQQQQQVSFHRIATATSANNQEQQQLLPIPTSAEPSRLSDKMITTNVSLTSGATLRLDSNHQGPSRMTGSGNQIGMQDKLSSLPTAALHDPGLTAEFPSGTMNSDSGVQEAINESAEDLFEKLVRVMEGCLADSDGNPFDPTPLPEDF